MSSWRWPWSSNLLLPLHKYWYYWHVQTYQFYVVLGIEPRIQAYSASTLTTGPYPQPKSPVSVERLIKPTFVDRTIRLFVLHRFYYCLCVCIHAFADMCANTVVVYKYSIPQNSPFGSCCVLSCVWYHTHFSSCEQLRLIKSCQIYLFSMREEICVSLERKSICPCDRCRLEGWILSL